LLILIARMKAKASIPAPIDSARSAGLRYVRDDRPGIRRTMSSLGFKYYRPDGRQIRNPAELKRLARLAIPPAWTDVWICPDPRGHLQATGRDARGRKQYRYHPQWRGTRDETKYERMPAFAAALPKIRTRTSSDLARPGLPREKVLAAVVQLLEKSLIRVGNGEYAKENKSFGLTTLRNKHVKVQGPTMRFEFRGKSGVRHSVKVTDRRLARIIKSCRDLPGQELFEYIDGNGNRCDVGSGDVNDYLREISGEDFTAKDFRTWAGTVLVCAAFRELAKGNLPASKRVVQAIDAVAGVLGNTRAVCRKSYIHPAVLDAYSNGRVEDVIGSGAAGRSRRGLSADECAVLAILERLSKQARKRAA
jgi:DNA topoisomerase I